MALTFVVQKHDARRLHYDFRLRIGDVLKSWAVPKGPSMNPKDKRLAVITEDHALSYGSFEGVIPEGEYGAGKVLLWDRGTYKMLPGKNDKVPTPKQAFRSGHFSFELKGKKLKGAFSLVKFRGDKDWLLIKKKDDHATSKDILKEAKSVKSGKTLKQIG